MKSEKAVFAGGCFWGLEHLFRRLPGVLEARSGYTGGKSENPTYEEVCSGETGHYEAVEITFDPDKVSYRELLEQFFQVHDFGQEDGQGPDIGPQYRSAVFYRSPEQEAAARETVRRLEAMGYRVATALLPAGAFWPAEDFHQRYYEKTGREPYCHVFRKIF